RVVLGEQLLQPGLVDPVDELPGLLAVTDDLGQGEGRGDQVQDRDAQERPHPGIRLEIEDTDRRGGEGNGEGGDGLTVEGGRALLLDRCVTHAEQHRPTWPAPHPFGYSGAVLSD